MKLAEDAPQVRPIAKVRTYSRGRGDSEASGLLSESEDELPVQPQLTSLSLVEKQAAKRAAAVAQEVVDEALGDSDNTDGQAHIRDVYKTKVEERANSVLSRLFQKGREAVESANEADVNALN
jgi:sorbitol-specific phosphotransferase system component IIBC